MLAVLPILFGASLTVATCWALGRLVLRRVPLCREELHLLAFVTGSACLSALTFLLCALHLARPGVFLAVALLAICGAALQRRGRLPAKLELVYDFDFGAEDYRKNASAWGLKLLGADGAARLYGSE
ncbi:MAG: hypothetical protein HYR60_20200 [Acidobacteria bacterium]|nr:hypothetical protein [Acidobacteriota bacterium]